MNYLGLWLNKKKPKNNIFFNKCLEELRKLIKQTLRFKNLSFDIRIQSFLMDLPAKASVLNVVQFNGEFGCITCDHPGESSKIQRKWVYPYKTKVRSIKIVF